MVPVFKASKIKPTKTVGQRLKSARLKREWTLEQAEQLTKVKLKYLEALEEDRHDLLPTEVYSLGFLRCYAEALRLNPRRLLDQYRIERQAVDTAKNQKLMALAPARRLGGPRFLLTPKTLLTFGSLAIVIGLIVYIVSGVQGFLAPPKLKITEPQADSRTTEKSVTVAGQTDPAVSLAINGELVVVDAEGKFRREIAVIPGLNTLELVAVNRIGKETRLSRKVLADYQVEPIASPSPTPSPSPSPSTSTSPSPTPSSTPKE